MKRLVLALLAAVCLLLPAAVAARAMEPSNLTVVTRYGGRALEGINVAVCRVADAGVSDGEIAYEVALAFSGAGADFKNLTAEKNIALASSLDAYASANNITREAKVTDYNGRVTFNNLSAGLYLVTQADGENSEYSIAPYLVAVPGPRAARVGGGAYSVTVYPKTEPVRRGAKTVSVSVYKVWEGTDSPPGSIAVQLYRNGGAYENSVSLTANNYWSHTWDNLDPGDTWTVDELSVPAGYTKKITGSASGGFIITNTKHPGTPGIPPSAVLSADPSAAPPKGSPPGPRSYAGGPKDPGSDGPKTDDPGRMRLWIALFAAAAVGLLAVACAANPKRLSCIFIKKHTTQ